MRNVLMANLTRLCKSKVFKIACSIVTVLGFYEIMSIYLDYKAGTGSPYFESGLMSISALGLFALAAIVSIYIGSEYSEGTLRNKVIIGLSRLNIYLSNVLTSMIASIVLVLGWTLAYAVPGLILMQSGNPLMLFIVMYLGLFFVMAVFSSLFTLITMCIGNKAGSAVTCLLLTLALLMHGIVVNSILDEPEFFSPGYVITDEGEFEADGELTPNPNYLPEGSTKRKVYEFMLDFVPGRQALQIAGMRYDSVKQIVLYDVGWIVVLNAVGLLVFKRKDLK